MNRKELCAYAGNDCGMCMNLADSIYICKFWFDIMCVAASLRILTGEEVNTYVYK